MDIMKVKNEQGNWVTVPAFQGQTGKTPSFSIGRVDLGTTPSSAAASITGTDEAPVLNLVLPKGIDGDTGPVGIAVQDTEPSEQLAWIDTSSTGNLVSIPEIKDNTVSVTDTWSSAKIRDFIYPVGSIYLSVNNVNPSTIFGGTWEQIQDTFLLAAGSTYTAGTTGGNSNHTHTTGDHILTIEEIPSHIHNTYYSMFASGSAKWGIDPGTRGTSTDGSNVTQPTGGSQAHNHGNTSTESNMPPYLAVYMWKRLS